jgi:hypothetical protein
MENARENFWTEAIATANRHKHAPYIEDVAQLVRPTQPTEDQISAMQIDSLDARASEFAEQYRDRLGYM